ncbi:hypothetical protein [Janthinobacterium aquaticum]|uniref:hypothetical protein n=1 Tax=Janthinobacterium sp. FT58W TaxID=2654254 RepID=UPI0012648A9C|nr:hypothetical protein [Janthinobacterium sp. FT58W]KAB8044629.1 hypothetical protein GCM43_05395 [Janthinobacterium sp. FT58W]
MRKMLAASFVLVATAAPIVQALAAETPIPRTMADKGKYYLLDVKTKGGIITSRHKRVGVNETGYSKTEINCKSMQYRDMGYSEDGPDKITDLPGKWTDVLAGSSKSDLVNFVCTRNP